MRQFKKFVPTAEMHNTLGEYMTNKANKQNIQKPDVYDVIGEIDKLVKKDNLAKEYRQESGQ
ncbi:MAG: hypothetical protein QME51_07525 [Planctomycetota bacterium]|nr:hypothetical protein [Planctomycetota bacterium]